jgi:hypothetical protein
MAASGATLRPAARVAARALRGARGASAVPMRAAPIGPFAAPPSPEDAAAQREALRAAVRTLTGTAANAAVPTREAMRAALPAGHPFHARKTLPSWDALADALVASSAGGAQKAATTRLIPAAAAAASSPAASSRRSASTAAAPSPSYDAGGPRPDVPLVPPRPLRPYQAAGVDFICARPATLLADEMGLGKTVQALAALAALQAFPAVVICPAFLKTNWARETAAWLPGARVQVLDGGSAELQPGLDLIIVNYDILPSHVDRLASLPLKALILDESQYIKTPSAQRTVAALSLSASARRNGARVLLLSGTPVLNRPVELLPQLEALGMAKAISATPKAYLDRYCDPKIKVVKQRGRLMRMTDYSGASNTAELNEKLTGAGFFLRRLKRDVLSELPPKSRVEVVVTLPAAAKKEYDVAAKALKGAGKDDPRVRGMMSSLRSKLALLKLPLVLHWIDGFLASAEPPRKLLVFAHHAALVDGIAAHCAGHLRVRGSDTPAARQAAVDAFQNGGPDGPRVIACNIAAAGVGLTLTAASDVLFAELAWAPMANAQAEDRAHRIGQQVSVTVTTLLAESTLDMVVSRVVDAKRRVVNAAVDGNARALPPPRPPPIGGAAPPAQQQQQQQGEDDVWGESSVAAEVAKELGMS